MHEIQDTWRSWRWCTFISRIPRSSVSFNRRTELSWDNLQGFNLQFRAAGGSASIVITATTLTCVNGAIVRVAAIILLCVLHFTLEGSLYLARENEARRKKKMASESATGLFLRSSIEILRSLLSSPSGVFLFLHLLPP